jgi:hypothetical protein
METKSGNRRRSGQASKTPFIWGFVWMSKRPVAPPAGRSTTRGGVSDGRLMPTFGTDVEPVAMGCPCRTTGRFSSVRETRAPSARCRRNRFASIIVTPPARCAASFAATAILASVTTTIIPTSTGPGRPIWRRRDVTIRWATLPIRIRAETAPTGPRGPSRAVWVGKSSENLHENSWQAACRLQACGPICP